MVEHGERRSVVVRLRDRLYTRQISRNVARTIAAERSFETSLGTVRVPLARAARLLGRPGVLYAVAILMMIWIAGNVALGRHAPDPPPFSFLNGAVGLVALCVAVLVLGAQTRMSRMATRRSHLGLQINLLVEQKASKVIELLSVHRHLGDDALARDTLVDQMKTSMDPTVVADLLAVVAEAADKPTEPPR